MSAQDNATILGKPNQNLVLETAGRVYVKVQDRFYELDFRNQGRGSGDTKIEIVNNNTTNPEMDMRGYVTKEFLKASLNNYVTKRSWADVKETQSMLENAMLDGFTESINPITVQTMQVIVGADQLQFEFVNDFEHAVETPYGPTLGKNSINFEDPGTGIFIKHYTLDGPTEVRPEDLENSAQLKMQYCRWQIAPKYFDLGDPATPYYIYIKVPRLQQNGYWINSSNPMTIYTKTNASSTSVYSQYGLGEFILSNTAIEMTEDNNYYYLLYGMVNSDDGNGRSFSTMNGFTEILPGQITAYIFKSASGDSYLDLRKNEFVLGDAFKWNEDGNHILYIKGAIVVDPGNNQSYMQLDRGMFHRYRYQTTQNGDFLESDFCEPSGAIHVEGNVYYPGNVVTWTNDKGLTSSYIYIYEPTQPNESQPNAFGGCIENPTSEDGYDENSTYFDPTNEKYWRVLAKGVRGYSNLIADLTNEMEAVACDKDGYVIAENGLDVVTQIGLFYGSSDVEIDKDQTLITLSNPEGSKITIDLSEILSINPQPVDPNASPNPTISVEIEAVQNSYLKTITFSLDHGLLLPEKCEIPITATSKDKFGEDQDDTRTIVFTLVGARSGKAYSLVPSARTIRRTPLGLYDPSRLECGVVCNGSSDNIDINEIVVKHVFGDTFLLHTTAHPEGVETSITAIPSYLNDFINDSNWDWDYTTVDDAYVDYISFDNPDYEKITFFLYYQDPLSFKWILCDKETILIVKDGDPGKDFSLSSSSQVFMYDEETSKVPSNSSITLKGIPKNINDVDYYEWQYRIPEHQSLNVWTSIAPNAREAYDSNPDHSYWWKPDNVSTDPSTPYIADSQLRSTLIVNAPIISNNVVNYRDFDTYFPRRTQNDETTRYRMCEFQVIIHYKELGVATTLIDSTSLHIIKGGDGALTVYLSNPSMVFASTEKKGVSPTQAERTEIIAYYGIEQILYPKLTVNDNLITYTYYNNDHTTYTGNTTNHITASSSLDQNNHTYVTVNTANSDNPPFLATSGEINIPISVQIDGKIQETYTVNRTINWNTAKQGEIGIAKQPRGRSDWNDNGYNGIEMYQGTTDEEDNWEGGSTQPWNEKRNIFFDIVRIVQGGNSPDLTYYCIKGGPNAALNKPGPNANNNWSTYWSLMTYSNIASDVAYINKGLIEELTVKELQTKGENYTTDIVVIKDETINIINSSGEAITKISSTNLPSDTSYPNTTVSVPSFSTTVSKVSDSDSLVLATINNLSSDNNVTTIPQFTVNVTASLATPSWNGPIGEETCSSVYIEVILVSGSKRYTLQDHFSTETRTSYTFTVPSCVVQLSPTGTWYLELLWNYSLNCNYITFSGSGFTITTKYQSTSNDGTVIGNNGFQTKWSTNKIKVDATKTSITGNLDIQANPLQIISNNSTINVSGTSTFAGTAQVTYDTTYNIVGSNQAKQLFVMATSSFPSSPTNNSLYFLY